MVDYGVKRLALGAALPPEEMDLVVDDAIRTPPSSGSWSGRALTEYVGPVTGAGGLLPGEF